MNFPFSRKTSVWRDPERPGRRERRDGSILIVTAFLFLALGTLALGMIFISRVYLKIGGQEKHSRLLEYGAENGIKESLHHLVSSIANISWPAILSEEHCNDLRADALGSGRLLAEEAAGLRFPVELLAREDKITWRGRIECQNQAVIEHESFFLTRFGLPVEAEGRLDGLSFVRSASLSVRLEILAGHIPLAAIPFFLDRDLPPEERDDFLEKNRIAFSPSSRELIPPQLSSSDAGLIPEDATPLLEKALDIEIFRPQDISAAKLRSVLGLEESQDPVPEGVYLIRNDLGLGGIYIRGDVEEIIAAIEEDFQVLSFRMESGQWILKYSPSQSRCFFRSPEEEEEFNFIPLGIIIVDGEVRSFGGGIVEAGGSVRLVSDQEVPSLLSGINLTLVASGEITITSHLLQQGISWQDGIPYVKSEQSQLAIFSTGRDHWSGDSREGGITISGDAPEDLKVQADLSAGGRGLVVEGMDKTLRLLGSVQATEYASSGRRLELTSWVPRMDRKGRPFYGPLTAQPVLLISRIRAADWKED